MWTKYMHMSQGERGIGGQIPQGIGKIFKFPSVLGKFGVVPPTAPPPLAIRCLPSKIILPYAADVSIAFVILFLHFNLHIFMNNPCANRNFRGLFEN